MKARLFKCSICLNILPWRERQNLRCSGKNAEIDKKGNVKWKHQVMGSKFSLFLKSYDFLQNSILIRVSRN